MNAQNIYKKSIAFFLQPIAQLLADDRISEIMINGINNVYFESGGIIHDSEIEFDSEKSLLAAIRNIAEYVNRPLYENCHSLDARLPNGERVHAIWPPSSRVGICITIRKFNRKEISLEQLVHRKSLSTKAAAALSKAVRDKKNIVVSGGTGTGKTTFLNALSCDVPKNERIIVIEDSSELKLSQKHTIYLETQNPDEHGEGAVSIRDLFVDSLRMRPDRIIVGEVRRGEALDLIQSMTCGHSGSLSTVHASSPDGAARRLETLCMMSDVVIPQIVARAQVASAIDYVVQLERRSDGTRLVSKISECEGLCDKGNYIWNELYSH